MGVKTGVENLKKLKKKIYNTEAKSTSACGLPKEIL